MLLFSTVISYAQNDINNYKNSTNKNMLEVDQSRQIPVSINEHNLKLTQNQHEYLNWLKGQNKKDYEAQLLSIHTEEKRYWWDDSSMAYLYGFAVSGGWDFYEQPKGYSWDGRINARPIRLF